MAGPSVGDVVDGRYEVEAIIGRGGMGTVWRARHVFTNVRVALKLLEDEYDAVAFDRFLAEARAASTIGHPAIVVVSDANRMANNQLYLAMELLVGKPLRMVMAGLDGDQIRRIGLETLDALGAAHARGIIHRDLKPENIFMVSPGSTVKLLDFGIAKVLGGNSSRTQVGGVLGTVEYMAPEQLADASDVDGRADLWALGTILFEMIAGVRPYGGTTPSEKYQALMSDQPMPIAELVRVAPEVSAFFATALARDRQRRFPSAAAMALALRALPLAGGAAPTTTAPGPTLGTGAGLVRPDAAVGPTLGTGAGWARPDAMPGPTLGTGAGWRPDAPLQTAPGFIAPPPVAKRGRTLALVVVGVVVVGGAIGFGVVAGSSRSTSSPTPADATVRVEVPADGTIAKPIVAGSCDQFCKDLGACKLAMPSCVMECNGNSAFQTCLSTAKTCDDRAACHWSKICGRPIKNAGMTCLDGLQCWAAVATQDLSIQCSNCYDLLARPAATALARFTVCNAISAVKGMELRADPDRDAKTQNFWLTTCQPLSVACTTGQSP